MIAEIDAELTEQVNRSCTTRTSRSWKGLAPGCITWSTTPKPTRCSRSRVMNILQTGTPQDLKKFKGTAWDQSPVFKRELYEEE